MRLRNVLNEIRQILCGKIESKVWIYLYLAGVWVVTYFFILVAYGKSHWIRPSVPSLRIVGILEVGVVLLFLIVFVRNIPVKRFWLRAGLALLALLVLFGLLPTL